MNSPAAALVCLFCISVTGCRAPSPADPMHEGEPHGPLTTENQNDGDGEAHPHGSVFRWNQRRDADGSTPSNAVTRMIEQRDSMLRAQPEMAASLLSNWKSLGPGNVGGRIRAIAIHPKTKTTMWIGSVAGGIWKTTNGGKSWSPLDGLTPALAISDLDIDPKDPKKLYASTGEGGFFDSVAGSSILAAVRGAGIFVTADGGTTWKQLTSTKTTDFEMVNRLTISPSDNKVLLAATWTGIFRSKDSGTTWSKRVSAATLDIDFHPTDGKLAIAGARDGVPSYSIDGGVSWKSATGIATSKRVEVAYSKSSPKTVYASVSQSDRIRIYRSTDGGQKYTARYTGTSIRTYSRYNNTLWVDPANPSLLLVGGVRMYRSTDGGAKWSNAYSGAYYDYHTIVSHPDFNGTTNQTVFCGNDGGIYRTTASRATTIQWKELNNNLGITQFYGAAITPAGKVLGGTQDNGTLLYTGNSEGWVRKIGGDGCFCAADPTDANYIYGQVYWIRIYRSTNGGNNFSLIASKTDIPDKGSNFIPYIVLDPNNVNRMYFAGAGVWQSNNIKATKPTWRQIKGPVTTCVGSPAPLTTSNAHFRIDPKCNVSTITPAKGNASIVWAGHNNGDVYVTSNALATTPTWTKVNAKPMPQRWVSHIAIDPNDNKRVYVSYLGYHADNVWRTTDSGKTWKRITGTSTTALPSSPVGGFTIHPSLTGCLFAGTDIGLYYSMDDGTTWTTTKEGSRTSPIDELIWKNTRTLVVVTHGRGIYTVDIGNVATSTTVGVGCGKVTAPQLTTTAPVVGKAIVMSLTNTPASSPVSLLLTAGTPTPSSLGAGCTAYIALGPATVILPLGNSTASGTWSTTMNVPRSPAFLGLVVTLQTIGLTSGGPALGIGEVSNGVKLVVGL